MASTIVYLSDCTPLYTTLGAPERITSVVATPLHRSAQLTWSIPPNSDKILVDSYIVRYKLTGAPITHVLNEKLVFFPTALITDLNNGVSYDFWVVAKNRFGESPHSPTVSVIPGSPPSPCQIVRRAFHSTTTGDGINDITPQKVGIEFTPGITQNGAQSLTFTAKYTRLNGGGQMTDVSYVTTYSVQSNEYFLDLSGQVAINTIGVKGNYIRKQITPPTGEAGFQSANYRFQVFSSNIYGISQPPDLSFNIALYSNTDANSGALIPRFTAPTFASYSIPENGGIVALDPSDSFIRLRWKQYRGGGTGSTGAGAYSGWSYRIQYTDDKDNWFFPPTTLTAPQTSYYPEYTREYDITTIGSNTANFEYTFDISRNIVNGKRYYVRYCVVNALGDTSEYTQVNTNNLSLVSCIPGKLPIPPPIFRANSGDRKVSLYFDWNPRPPSLSLTGGLPILDYRIERYDVSRTINGVIIVSSTPSVVFDNIKGPFYEDTYEIIFNGFEYEYRVYSRNSFGYSRTFSSVRAVPFFPSDVIRNVSSSVDSGEITLAWDDPETIEPEAPIVQYYIEYKIFNLYNISDIPAGNILGNLSGLTMISNTIQDMKNILVDDVLWDKIQSSTVGIFTNSMARSFTIRGLFNGTAYVFRIAAVTQDVARRKIIGLRKVIASNSPYLPRPVIIGIVPSRLLYVKYMNLDSNIMITWSSNNIQNTEGIIRFIVDYDIAPSETGYSQQQTFEYNNSIVSNDATSVSFQINVVGLSNNVVQRPDPRTNSYVMKIYAENSVGFTNEQNKVKLHVEISFDDIYENVTVPRVVRPMSIPSIVSEVTS